MQNFLKGSLLACLVASLVLFAAPAWAQETGSLSGRVVDPDGAPLPGVAVTVESTLVPEATVYTQSNGAFRFPALPPGTAAYTLTFSLEGFQTVVQEDLNVRLGSNTEIRVTLTLSTVEETVTVTGATPIVDVKDTGTGTNITEEYMQSIPSARDPWVMMQQTASMQVTQENIGGSASGQQSGFSAGGTRGGDSVWTYDGAEMTDMTALGASPMYYDFDAFEEISISTGGNDPSVATGGVRINFVTKRGSSEWRGSGRFYITDGSLQSLNVGDPETGELVGNFSADDLFPGYIGNSIDNIKDWGAEIGGPVIEDRAFVWGSYGKQDIKQNVGVFPDNTQLENIHAKANIHASDDLVLNYTFIDAAKTKQGRGVSATRPGPTTWDQGGNCCIHTGKAQWTIDDNNYVEGSYNFTNLGFFLEPQGGRQAQPTWDLGSGAWTNSIYFYDTVRPLKNIRVDANSYIAGADVDHELKYGFSWRNAQTTSISGMPSGSMAVLFNGAPFAVGIGFDREASFEGTRYSAYAGDTLTTDRLTINVGLRYDNQDSKELPSSRAANAFAPDILPAITFAGAETDFAWNSISPRVGLTYQLPNDKTVLQANAARYYAQMANNEFALRNKTFGAQLFFFWADPDGDGAAQRDEVIPNPWSVSGGFDPANPNGERPVVINATDPPITDELIFGLEHELSRDLAVGADFTYRKNHRENWTIRTGEDNPDAWTPVTETRTGADGRTETITWYHTVDPRTSENTYQERQDFNTAYSGLTVFLEKRFADKWMANTSFTYANPSINYEGPFSFTDPTNVELQDGQPGSNTTSATYFFKLSGMYQLPGGFNLAGFFQFREGYIFDPTFRVTSRPNGAGTVNVLTVPTGDERLENFWNLDLRLEKALEVGDAARAHFIVDAFNLTNNDVILGRASNLSSGTFNTISNVVQGRTIRFGVRLVVR